MTDPRLDDFLAGLPNFEDLSVRDRQALSIALEYRTHPAGTRIVRQGTKGDGAYFLVSGTLNITIEQDGTSRTVGTMGPGALFGVLAMVDHRPRSASCDAATDVGVAFLSRPAFELLAHRHASIGYPFQRAVAAQVAADFRQIVSRARGHLGA